MRKTLALACILLGLSLCSFGQGGNPQPARNYDTISTYQLIIPVNVGDPTPPYGASVNVIGTPGITTYYYWLVANYTAGPSRPAGPFSVTNGANTLTSSNYNTIFPNVPTYAQSYDLLRTSTPAPPSGACNCAVATAQAITAVVNDQSPSLNSYTVGVSMLSSLYLTMKNEITASGVSHLILRQGPLALFVADLSQMGAAQYMKLRCESGLGDGLNAIAAGTYQQTNCYNDSGVTWTILGIRCNTDNNGTSTLNVANSSSTGLLTGPITCTNSFASGTQSATVTIAAGTWVKFTFVADGTTKQTNWVVSLTQ